MKKKLLIIIPSVLAAIGLIVALVFAILHFAKKQDPVFSISNSDFLTSYPAWQAEDDRIIWQFLPDGTGQLTTNNHTDDYKFTWQLSKNTLQITTAWHYDLEDTFSFTTDREAETFTIVDKTEGKITTFHHIDDFDTKSTNNHSANDANNQPSNTEPTP